MIYIEKLQRAGSGLYTTINLNHSYDQLLGGSQRTTICQCPSCEERSGNTHTPQKKERKQTTQHDSEYIWPASDRTELKNII